MWSRSGSTLWPVSLTTLPLTVTLPAAIISSASRRDATPAAASTFCKRSDMARSGQHAREILAGSITQIPRGGDRRSLGVLPAVCPSEWLLLLDRQREDERIALRPAGVDVDR